jgi:uncharacterized protein
VTAGLEDAFRAWLEADRFTCLGARASSWRGELTVRSYGPMGTQERTRDLHDDLVEFLAIDGGPTDGFRSFAALFTDTACWSEREFETRLWQQLQDLHDIDRHGFAWAEDVSMDPAVFDFGFSVAVHPLFVVGLHPGASRISRRFTTPALVFNSHRQFTALKRAGVYQGLRKAIRRREQALQGDLNPMLADFGEQSEASQYAGREVPADWVCPFRPFS